MSKVTPDVQHLHFQKYNRWWSVNARKVKKTVRNRIRWNEEQWTTNVNHCALFVFVVRQCRDDPNVTEEMYENMKAGFLNGFLGQTRIILELPYNGE